MNLSRLHLNPRNPDAQRDIASPYDMHRTLKRAFTKGEPDANRMLFRTEPWQPGACGVTVLVQNATASPDWSFLDGRTDGYCLAVEGPKSFDPAFQAGQQLSFRLLGNATKKREGKRIALDDETAYHDWLKRKADQSGFQVLQVTASSYWINEEHLARSPENGYKKRNIPHFGVRFDGLLRITDPDELVKAVRRGVGPAKAFGFGLLSLARAASR